MLCPTKKQRVKALKKGNNMKNLLNQNEIKAINTVVDAEKSTVKESVKNAKTSDLNYDASKIKVSIEGTLMTSISEYYTITTHLLKVRARYSSNVAVLSKDIENIMTKEEVTKQDIEKIKELEHQKAVSKALWSFFNKKAQKELLKASSIISKELYEAFENRLNDESGYRQAIKTWIESLTGRKLKDNSFIDFICASIGAMKRSSWSAKMDGKFASSLNMNPFTYMFMDLLLDLALRKKAISTVVIDKTLSTTIEEIEDFASITVIDKPTAKTTAKQYQAILDSVNASYDSKKKADLMKAYQKALKDGLFVEA